MTDLYPISIYIIFLRSHISYSFLSTLCSLEFPSLWTFRGDIHGIFRNGDEATWQKHLEWYSTQHRWSVPLKFVSDILQLEKAFTVEEYKKTHTHSYTSSCLQIFFGKLFLKILQHSQETPVSEFLFVFSCEYGKIKFFCRTPLVAVSVPCFFLKLFLKLFVYLNYLFHCLNNFLYLKCISNTCNFLILFLYSYQAGKYIFKLNNWANVKYFLSH